jgi:predicted nucleic acid-binding protein
MSGRTFVDTNVLVYLFDAGSPRKQETARAIVSELGRSGRAVVSTQVLQELYVTVTRKLSPPLSSAEGAAATEGLTALSIVQIDTPMILAAIARCREASISLWDSLIVEAALAGQCDLLLSEDLQDGRAFGSLRVENPFR